MGLDMYLSKETDEGTVMIGLWRKSNAVHNWFVQNVQEGEDDCRQYVVTLEHLQELARRCKEVLEDHSKASDLLPTVGGFFFGSTEYSEGYFNILEYTLEILSKCDKDCKYYYQSSW